jgi:hypothetical protein
MVNAEHRVFESIVLFAVDKHGDIHPFVNPIDDDLRCGFRETVRQRRRRLAFRRSRFVKHGVRARLGEQHAIDDIVAGAGIVNLFNGAGKPNPVNRDNAGVRYVNNRRLNHRVRDRNIRQRLD